VDANSEARLSLVWPRLADKIRQLASLLAQEGIELRVTQGLRSWTEQDALYAKGRTTPGAKVTNAPGGHSWHNMGMAVDVVPDDTTITGFQCDWNINHPAWARIVALAATLGLDSGATWRTFKDWPHLQMTGRFPEGAPNDEARQLMRDAGMEAVWQEAVI
jgi:peptidoglycan L-alanyl-D-glutamate endopeptidase CwlK